VTVTILKGDARALPLAEASVDLIVTSPPFWGLRSYTDAGEHYDGQIGAEPTPTAYVDSLIACTREWMRVLKPTGSIWVNLGDKYATNPRGPNGSSSGLTNGAQLRPGLARASQCGVQPKSLLGMPWRYALRCIDNLGLALRAEVIWSKPNGLPESVTDRVRRAHETWFHLVKQPRNYFASIDSIREPKSDYSRKPGANRATPGGQRRRAMADVCNPKGRLPGSVREVATQPLRVPAELAVDHFAAFPMEWPRWIISGWAPEGGTVLDPFGGTGTTALVADVLGRHGISVDMSADYCRLAQWRTTDPKQLERATRGPRRAAA
jgi:site-specific DNA-methyltransferase (cytosine-N4-specific)